LNDNFKDVLSSHFDDVASDNKLTFEVYGSDEMHPFLRAPYKYVENNLLENIENKNILDYCCGTGTYSVIPALKNANVYGIDISDKSIGIAKKRAEALDISNSCDFKVGDAEKLEFKDNFFDLILSYGSLSYLDKEKSFEELRRVLKPGGKLVIIDSLGYNPILNYNRRKNIQNYAPNYVEQLSTITNKDLKVSLKYFEKYSLEYFDFFTVLGKVIVGNNILKKEPSALFILDKFFLKIPILNKLSFKFVCVIS
jgi:ubiquinone/menaquinone biosynthesis C-methylase UbiE